MLVFGIISPHPPIILPEIGGSDLPKVAATIKALEQAVAAVSATRPDRLIIIAPHEGHGFAVPEYFLRQQLPADLSIEQILVTESSYQYYADYGREIGRQIQADRERVAIIASGDLSHVLAADGPYGFNAAGPQLDQAIVQAVRAGDLSALLSIEPAILDAGAECGLRSIIFLLGAYEGAKQPITPRVLSYEAPFGVGYMVATFAPVAKPNIATASLNLARAAIAHYLETGQQLPQPASLPAALKHPGATFVSLHQPDGELRGCIGTVTPTQPSLAAEIITNAVAAATADSRFEPVTRDEFNHLNLSVDVLSKPRPVSDSSQLDPQRYGVIVTASDGRRGVLLPRLDGVTTVAEQIAICRDKADIGPNEPVELMQFEVERFEAARE